MHDNIWEAKCPPLFSQLVGLVFNGLDKGIFSLSLCVPYLYLPLQKIKWKELLDHVAQMITKYILGALLICIFILVNSYFQMVIYPRRNPTSRV